MSEEKMVVNPTEPTPVETVQEEVVQEVASPETLQVETPQVEAPAPEAVQKSVDSLDEYGVPYKNRYMEYKRKLEKAEEEKQRLLQQSQNQQQTQKKYSISELEEFSRETDNPAHRQWAIAEAEKIREEKQAEIVRKEIEKVQNTTKAEVIKQQTYNGVVQRNPELVIKDQYGNHVWNTRSPLFQRIAQYMQDPDFSSNPRGLEAAERFALVDIMRNSVPAVSKTLTKTNNELKNLQKKTLVESGVNQPIQTVNSLEAAKEKLKNTGSKEDATLAMKEILKAQGILSDE